MFPTQFARQQFPALQTPWALMDNAGGSAPCLPVIMRVTDYMSRLQVQHGASYPLSAQASATFQAGKQAAAELINASPHEVVCGASSTVLMRLLSQALSADWKAGDEVIVTNLDHEANIGPWRALEERGIVIREWCFRPESMRLELEDLESLLNERTRLVAFTHCANVVGNLHPIKSWIERIHKAGALACVDGVAFAPHRRVDVKELGADFYVLSLYKVYGPHLGLLYGKREHLLRAKSQNHFFVGEDQVPYKLEPGNVTHELMASLPGICEYLTTLATQAGGEANLDTAFEHIAQREQQLGEPLIEFLREHPRVHLLGEPTADAAVRVPTVAFWIEGMDSKEVVEKLEASQLAVRYGHFYAHRAMECLGLHERNGIVRASLLHYNTEQEVERLITALKSDCLA